MAGDAGGVRDWSSREFTVIRKDLLGLGRPPTQDELYPLGLLEFGLFGLPSPTPFQNRVGKRVPTEVGRAVRECRCPRLWSLGPRRRREQDIST